MAEKTSGSDTRRRAGGRVRVTSIFRREWEQPFQCTLRQRTNAFARATYVRRQRAINHGRPRRLMYARREPSGTMAVALGEILQEDCFGSRIRHGR